MHLFKSDEEYNNVYKLQIKERLHCEYTLPHISYSSVKKQDDLTFIKLFVYLSGNVNFKINFSAHPLAKSIHKVSVTVSGVRKVKL